MKKYITLMIMAGAVMAAHAATDVAAVLTATDRFRATVENMQIDTQVTVFNRDGTPDKERRYTVITQSGHKTLVLMLSPTEVGRKLLMLDDEFWLVMPTSQRPLRITPSQKLLGDVSSGDIATLSWAQDYTGTLVGEESCEAAAPAGAKANASRPCLHLTLQGARKGLSYARIELWVGKDRYEPLRAELYVQSAKLAKVASFVLDKPAAPTQVTEMVLTDKLSSHKETRVRYLSRQAKQVPESWLNPTFLARNPALQ
jgi:outer membrane lipoprotein-sorting protein